MDTDQYGYSNPKNKTSNKQRNGVVVLQILTLIDDFETNLKGNYLTLNLFHLTFFNNNRNCVRNSWFSICNW